MRYPLRRIYRTVEFSHRGSVVRGPAVIDPGMPRVVIPRRWAEDLGIVLEGQHLSEGNNVLSIGSKKSKAVRQMVQMRVLRASRCSGRTLTVIPDQYLVPWDDHIQKEVALIGSLFLQRHQAQIRYDQRHAVRCSNPQAPWIEQGFGLGEEFE